MPNDCSFLSYKKRRRKKADFAISDALIGATPIHLKRRRELDSIFMGLLIR